MANKLAILVCENLRREAEASLEFGAFEDVRLLTFPSDCVRPESGWDKIKACLAGVDRDFSQVGIVAGHSCVPGGNPPDSIGPCRIRRQEQCAHLFVSKRTADAYSKDGAYLLIPGWLSRWQQYLTEWGLDQRTAREYFAQFATRLVLLDTGVDEESAGHLQDLASFLGLPFDIEPVGLDTLRLQLENMVLRWRLEAKERGPAGLPEPERQAADYATALSLVDRLAGFASEPEVTGAMLDLFTRLFEPGRVAYLPIDGGGPGAMIVRPPSISDAQALTRRLAAVTEDYAWTESGKGFVLPVMHDGERVGVLEIDGIASPEYKEHYLKLALAVGRLCGLAISKARIYGQMKRAEEDLRSLSRAMEQSPATVVITDTAGNIEYANPKFAETTGYSVEEAIGSNPRILKSGEIPAEEYKELWATISSGREWRGEFHNRRKNGELYWEFASISPIRDSSGNITHYLAVKEDITERKRADESIRRLNQNLEQRAAELDAVNKELETFSYSVSHDLRAPLRHIDGFSRALQEDYGDRLDDEGREFLRRVRAASQRMAQLIDDMLMLSRVTRQEIRHEGVNLSALVEDIAADLRQADPERRADFVIAPALAVQGDYRLLRVVLENLLRNAWKFTSTRAHAIIEFGVTEHGGKRAYFVRDNGVGFDMAYAGKLFGAFQRLHTESEFPGTGIGLATVQRIIRRHGGQAWAEGTPDQGATFYFTIPAR